MADLKDITENVDVQDTGTEKTDEKSVEDKDKAAAEQEKKYTDSDVDKIVAKKIMRERERMQKLFTGEQQLSDIEKRERDVQRREFKADAKDMLIECGLPCSLAEILNYESREEMEKSLDIVEKCVKAAVQSEIKKAFRGETPKKGDVSAAEIDREKRIRNAFKAR